jgi:hypothetical protein
MRVRKMMLLPAGLLAVAAFGSPTWASAAQWTHEGEPLVENRQITLKGTVSFLNALGSVDCTVHARALLTAGSDAGEVVEFSVGSRQKNAPSPEHSERTARKDRRPWSQKESHGP